MSRLSQISQYAQKGAIKYKRSICSPTRRYPLRTTTKCGPLASSQCLLASSDAASKMRRSTSHHDQFPDALDTSVRRVPSKAASCGVGRSTNANGWTGLYTANSRAASDGPMGLTYTSVELKGSHQALLPIHRPNHCRSRASAKTKVFSRHLAGATGDELVVHARTLG